MLPQVIRFNGADEQVAAWYRELAADGAEGLAQLFGQWRELAKLPSRLDDRNIPREHLPQLAEDAARQWTGTFNPRPVDAEILLVLYEQSC